MVLLLLVALMEHVQIVEWAGKGKMARTWDEDGCVKWDR